MTRLCTAASYFPGKISCQWNFGLSSVNALSVCTCWRVDNQHLLQVDPQKVECEKDLARPEEKLDGPSYSLDISTCDMKNAISNVRTVPPATAQVPDVVKDAASTGQSVCPIPVGSMEFSCCKILLVICLPPRCINHWFNSIKLVDVRKDGWSGHQQLVPTSPWIKRSKVKSIIWYPDFLKVDSDAALLPSWFHW